MSAQNNPLALSFTNPQKFDDFHDAQFFADIMQERGNTILINRSGPPYFVGWAAPELSDPEIADERVELAGLRCGCAGPHFYGPQIYPDGPRRQFDVSTARAEQHAVRWVAGGILFGLFWREALRGLGIVWRWVF